MYTQDLDVSDYVKRFYRVFINAAHVEVIDRKTKEQLFHRGSGPNGLDENWWDSKHVRIVNAIHELEAAIFDAVDSETKEN